MNNQKNFLIFPLRLLERLSLKIILIFWGILAIAIISLVLIRTVPYIDFPEIFKSILAAIDTMGYWAALTFILLYIICSLCFVPISLLTVGAGIIFGLTLGSVYVCIATAIAAIIAFTIGRYLALDWVEQKIENNLHFNMINHAVAREGWKIVFLARISPFFPFSVANYIFSISRISLKDYFFASLLGLIPSNIIYVYFGSLAGELANLDLQFSPKNQSELIWQILGIALTIAGTIYITHITKKALATNELTVGAKHFGE